MSVIETLALISQTLAKMIDFSINNEVCQQAFEDYLEKTQNEEVENVYALLPEFIINGRIGDEHKKFCDYFIEQTQKLGEEEKQIALSVGNAIESVFEVKKVLKGGFELYNIINEKNYSVVPLVKMSHFRGIFAGHYITATLINYLGESYLIEIKESYTSAEANDVASIAVAYIISRPESTYKDNEEKLKQTTDFVKQSREKFWECFGTNEIIATNDSVDELIKIYDDFCTGKKSKEECRELIKNIQTPTEYKYYEPEDFKNSIDNFMEKSFEEFSSHSEVYDVGYVFDDELGNFVIPFYGTLKQIFEVKDYKTIEGYEECVNKFLENESVPSNILCTLSKQYPNFIKIINEILGTKYTLDELIKKYKYRNLEQKIYASSAVLHNSEIFNSALNKVFAQEEEESEEVSETQETPQIPVVGRNEPCPCGSGLKYKKCCMNKQ